MSSFRVAKLPEAADLPLPAYQTRGSAGMDLRACVESEITIPPGKIIVVPTGLVIALPEGFEAQVRPRSGLAFRHGVTVLNSPGTIDSDFRGELRVLLINHGSEDFVVRRGDRVAQLVVCRHEQIEWTEVSCLDAAETDRGEGGYGSTGIN